MTGGKVLQSGYQSCWYTNAKDDIVKMNGLRAIMCSADWEAMDDEQRIKRVKEEADKAKELIIVSTAKRKKEGCVWHSSSPGCLNTARTREPGDTCMRW